MGRNLDPYLGREMYWGEDISELVDYQGLEEGFPPAAFKGQAFEIMVRDGQKLRQHTRGVQSKTAGVVARYHRA
jgi:hypothetical protein